MRAVTESTQFVASKDFIREYVCLAPLPLAIERAYECELLARQIWMRPCLDVGCGDGIFAKVLFEDKIDVGLDLNAKEIERAAKLNVYKELVCCSANEISFPDGHFNTIFSNSVLEHIPDIESVLKELNRVLSSGGNLYLTLPTDHFDKHTLAQRALTLFSPRLASRFRGFFNSFWNHYHYYSVDRWSALFERVGFRVVKAVTYDSSQSCHVNNAITVFSLPAAFCRKVLNRWFFSNYLRRLLSPLLVLWARCLMDSSDRLPKSDDGLVFFHLIKR